MTPFARLALAAALAAALPAGAQQKAAPAAAPPATAAAAPTFETAALGPSAWYGRFGMTNCAWIDLGDGVLLVDTGADMGQTAHVLAEVKRTANKPVRWIVLTHLHQDSNGGLPTLFPADVTVFANQKVAGPVAAAIEKHAAPGKHATVVSVPERLTVAIGANTLELLTPRGPAHTDHDLVAWVPQAGIAFVGDLLTPGRCPMMSDAATDPRGWDTMLDRVLALHPAIVVASRGNAAIRGGAGGLDLDKEAQATRNYIDRMLKVLKKIRAEKGAESRVSSELRLSGVTSYCPTELDAVNGLALYRRMTADGQFRQGNDLAPAKAKPAAKPAASAPKKK